MDNLQYYEDDNVDYEDEDCFKPYYKWITFNTLNLNKNIDFMIL